MLLCLLPSYVMLAFPCNVRDAQPAQSGVGPYHNNGIVPRRLPCAAEAPPFAPCFFDVHSDCHPAERAHGVDVQDLGLPKLQGMARLLARPTYGGDRAICGLGGGGKAGSLSFFRDLGAGPAHIVSGHHRCLSLRSTAVQTVLAILAFQP